MPCFDPREKQAKEAALEMQGKWSPMLCEAMALVEAAGTLDRCSPELRTWWETHKEHDAQREPR